MHAVELVGVLGGISLARFKQIQLVEEELKFGLQSTRTR